MECAYIYEPLPSAIGGQSSMAVNQANLENSRLVKLTISDDAIQA